MIYRPDSEKQGFVNVLYVGGSRLILKRSEYDRLTSAMQEGKTFVECQDLYGDPITIRLEFVIHACDCSAAAIAASDLEDEERRAHEKTHGDG